MSVVLQLLIYGVRSVHLYGRGKCVYVELTNYHVYMYVHVPMAVPDSAHSPIKNCSHFRCQGTIKFVGRKSTKFGDIKSLIYSCEINRSQVLSPVYGQR